MQLRRLVYLRNHLMTIFFNSDLERSFNLILNSIVTKKLESFVVLLKRWKRKRRSKIKMLKSLRKKEENDLCLSQFNSFLTIFLFSIHLLNVNIGRLVSLQCSKLHSWILSCVGPVHISLSDIKVRSCYTS